MNDMRSNLTDDQCDEFRRLPVSFNDMLRATYAAGAASQGEQEPVAWIVEFSRPSGIARNVPDKLLVWSEASAKAQIDASLITALKPLYAAPLPQGEQCPSGYVLMPIEPTPEMLLICDSDDGGWNTPKQLYAALIKAAQPKDTK